MRRVATLSAALTAVALLAVACMPPPAPSPPAPYLDRVFSATVTPKDQPITWGAAPAIDANYGGTLYAGTSIEAPDPRPALLPGGDEPLRMWVANPQDDRTDRPAILWVHGGGFALGIDSMYGLAASTGRDYAERGYVGFSIEYRTDTTLVDDGTATAQAGPGRPPSLCQWVQDNQNPADPVWVARQEQCQRNVLAAQQDVQAAVRWIRQHAAMLRVDPNRIAIGGFSAGAVTAANVAYRSDDVGSVHYFPGDDLSVESSRTQAAFGASGCEYDPTSIGAGDAPTSWIHSKFDVAVPYDCAATTVTVARNAGLTAELTSYCNESGHASTLYDEHRDATDAQWTTFLARELKLYSGMRAPSSDPVCS